MPQSDKFNEVFSHVCVSVPVGDLRYLCRLAREAGEDLQHAARVAYPLDNPSSVRRMNNEINEAQKVIDAANIMQTHFSEATE